MNTQKKRRPASVISLHRAYCDICRRAMKPGRESAQEIGARVHRACLQKSTRRQLNESKCHDLWLEAYSMLCRKMPAPRESIIPLACEYIGRLSLENYLEFVRRASLMVAQQSLPDEVKSDLIELLARVESDMIRLMAEAD